MILTSFAQSLSNFTCMLWIMRGGTLLNWDHRIKGQFEHSVFKRCGQDTAYSFSPITFKIHMKVVDDERRNLIDYGSKVKAIFGTLCIKPCGQDTDYM